MTPEREAELREACAGRGRCSCAHAPCLHDMTGGADEVFAALDETRRERDEALAAYEALSTLLRDLESSIRLKADAAYHDADDHRFAEFAEKQVKIREAARRALASAPAALSAQYRARVLREAADVCDEVIKDWYNPRDFAARLRAFADAAEKGMP